MEFGNGFRTILHLTAVGVVIGLLGLVGVAVVMGLTGQGAGFQHYLALPLRVFVPALAPLVLLALAATAFRVRIAGGKVQHLFLKRFILSECLAADFVRVEGVGAGTALVFQGGRRMRLFVLGTGEGEEALDRLLQALEVPRPRTPPLCQARCRPSRPPTINPDWLRWDGGTVLRIAQAIAANGWFEDLPVLADALEEAGCDDRALLEHCRGPGPHVGDCWVVAALLGKGCPSLQGGRRSSTWRE